jgi:surface carbohydrate biosynthesis protein (TIGR04326 family)
MNVIISDNEFDLIKSNDLVILWNQYEQNNINYISIPKYVEENCKIYKNLFLDIVAKIGNHKINNKSILQIFKRESTFNFWWLTSIQLKSNIDDKSGVNNCIKLLALNDIINNNQISSISIITKNESLLNSIKELCYSKKIKFSNSEINHIKNTTGINIIESLIFTLKYIYFNLINFRIINRSLLRSEIAFFDIFVHLKEKSFFTNKFHSSYWNDLVNVLKNSNYKITWTHLFYSHKTIPKFSNAKELTNKFNKYDSRNMKHLFLEDYLSLNIIIKALFVYFNTFRSYYTVYKNSKFFLKYNDVNFYYFLKDEFNESLFGKSRIVNEIRLFSFDVLFKKSKKQTYGFYIQENQPWEIILVSKWKKYNHGKIFGVPHSTVRFWDLRYFDTTENLLLKNNILPDSILVNSTYAFDLLKNEIYNNSNLLIVEALRYQHLNDHCFNNNYNKVVIFGDFQYKTTKKILEIINNARTNLNRNITFYFKQHPAFYFDLSLYDFEEDKRSTDEILQNYNIVITSDISSTSTEAYTLGLIVLQYLDGSKLNFSPIKGLEQTIVFNNSQSLSNNIEKIQLNKSNIIRNSKKYFYINKDLSKWKEILQIKK